MNVLVVNAGSGSLKLDVLDAGDQPLFGREVDAPPDGPEARAALDAVLEEARDCIDAVGHRFVHGGSELTQSSRIDERVRQALEAAKDLAPLHVPPALAALDAVQRRLPGVPEVACVDTAFHADLPEPARTYAIPTQWRERHGIRRYGFHGLSYAWALRRTAELLERPVADLHVVLAHLGGGASVCAVSGGRSVWTSMGFTPLEGLVMVKRSGSLDPGILLWLQTSRGMNVDEIAHGLEHHSGLLGLSNGRSGDTRELVRAAAEGDDQARLAIDVYTLRARQEIAAAAATLPRIDGFVFTGQIGADQPEIREAICAGLTVLGIDSGLDPHQDEDRVLSRSGARIPVALVHSREDRQIAAEVRRLADSG